MANKKPCDRIEAFSGDSIYDVKEDMNAWLEDHPDFYLDRMEMVRSNNTGYITILCDFCLREDFEDEEHEEHKDETNLTNELLKGLIGAINELSDTVKELTNKKESL